MDALQTKQHSAPALTNVGLHLVGMLCMLADHVWAVTSLQAEWLSWIGRLAFPIFAFLLAEGYAHTRSVKRYALRLLLLALVSEIPFDLIYGGTPWYPFHQNAVWTLLLGLAAIHANACAARSGGLLRRVLTALLSVLLGYLIGMVTMVDYYGVGVLTVLLFWFFRGRTPVHLLLQSVGLFVLHGRLLGGQVYPVVLLGMRFEIAKQTLALLALVPIWMYGGERGPQHRWVRLGYYAFYPLHLLLLYVITGNF